MSAKNIQVKIDEWIKLTGASLQDLTQQNQDNISNLYFLYQVGDVMFSLQSNRLDRIKVFSQLTLNPEHQEAFGRLQGDELEIFLQQIKSPIQSVVLEINFIKNPQNQERYAMITISGNIDTEFISREPFYQLWNKVSYLQSDTKRRIKIQFTSGSVKLGN